MKLLDDLLSGLDMKATYRQIRGIVKLVMMRNKGSSIDIFPCIASAKHGFLKKIQA